MNTEAINDQGGEIRVLSWNINGLGSKMADPDLLEFIREYDIIFLTETMKGRLMITHWYNPGTSSIM